MILPNIRIATRLRLNVAILVFLLTMYAFSAFYGFNQVNNSFQSLRIDVVPDITTILEVRSISTRIFAEIQGYMATQDEGEIKEFEDSIERCHKAIASWTIKHDDDEEQELKRTVATYVYFFDILGHKVFKHNKIAVAKRKVMEADKNAILQKSYAVLASNQDSAQQLLLNNFIISVLDLQTAAHNLMTVEEEKSEEEALLEYAAIHGLAGLDEEKIEIIHKKQQSLMRILAKLSHLPEYHSLRELASNFAEAAEQVAISRHSAMEYLEQVENTEDLIFDFIDVAIELQTEEVQGAYLLAEERIASSMYLLIGLGVVCCVLFIASSKALRTSIMQPVTELLDATKHISDGNFTHRAKVLSNDELGLVTASFNDMVNKLRETTVSKEYVERVIYSVSDPLIVTDASGIITEANQSAFDFLGSKRELLGTHIGHSIRDTYALFKAKDLSGLISAGAVKAREETAIKHDGTLAPVLFSASLLRDAEGVIHGAVCVLSDVSELKCVQNELEESYDILKRTQEQLVQSGKLASIGELAAGVAHELNQPLMLIRTNAQLMERKLQKKSNEMSMETIKESYTSTLKNTQRMMNIINHLRTFSRQAPHKTSPTDVNRAIQESFLLISEQFKTQGITVRQKLEDKLPTIMADANQLEQVFLNLLSNARDAINAKDAKDAKELTITTRLVPDDKNMLEILVRDSGTGIPRDARDKIFDPFYTTKDVGKGTGLGLSISYGIIQDFGGNIDVPHTGPEGTTFRVRLPVRG